MEISNIIERLSANSKEETLYLLADLCILSVERQAKTEKKFISEAFIVDAELVNALNVFNIKDILTTEDFNFLKKAFKHKGYRHFDSLNTKCFTILRLRKYNWKHIDNLLAYIFRKIFKKKK